MLFQYEKYTKPAQSKLEKWFISVLVWALKKCPSIAGVQLVTWEDINSAINDAQTSYFNAVMAKEARNESPPNYH